MIEVSWFFDGCLLICHDKKEKVSPNLIKRGDLAFVYGYLMDPYFIKKLAGRIMPMAPAILRGFKRKTIKDKNGTRFSLQKKEGSILQGVVLCLTKKSDLKALDKFEDVPNFRSRIKMRVEIGDIKRDVQMFMENKLIKKYVKYAKFISERPF